MSVINTNIAARIATNAIIRNDRHSETAMTRLATGLRINSAKDDAAGLAITQRMKAEVSGLEMSARNASDAISMLQVADGATVEIAAMFQRMRELAVQAATGTYSFTDRQALDLEFAAMYQEIDRIANNTTWNTMSIMNGQLANGNDMATGADPTTLLDVTSATIQLGKSVNQTMGLNIKSFRPEHAADFTHINGTVTGDGIAVAVAYAAGAATNANYADATTPASDNPSVTHASHAYGSAILWTGGDGGVFGGVAGAANERLEILSQQQAGFALTQLDIAITALSTERAKFGASVSRLQHATDNLLNVATNQDLSRSRIEDADYAVETSELSRTQIIAQASTAMLAQANKKAQNVLALLRD